MALSVPEIVCFRRWVDDKDVSIATRYYMFPNNIPIAVGDAALSEGGLAYLEVAGLDQSVQSVEAPGVAIYQILDDRWIIGKILVTGEIGEATGVAGIER